ncbi:MAG: sporulation integral membrane protein YtvI [Oscillospiraceae bacterium]|jgi:sporulation integral membrane protein YtvI|nr:sporulation integral membrane protein YtvI [Oscillospiraceae bacterium]
MPEKRHLELLWKCFIALLIIAGAWLFLRFAFRPLLPFIIAFILARLMEAPVRFLCLRIRFPRPVCAGIVTAAVLGVLVAIIVALGSLIIGEINRLLDNLPSFMARLPVITGDWRQRVDVWIAAAPLSIQDILRSGFNSFLEGSAAIPGEIYSRAGAFVASLASGVPGTVMFIVTVVLGTFFISSEYPKLSALIIRPFKPETREKILRAKNHLALTLGKWIKAQAILMLITFVLLLIGFLMMGIDYAIIAAGITALLDALPVIGIAMILLPWALYLFFTGETALGVAMLLLFAIISLVRGLIEPRLVGRQIGLSPLLTLMAMYIGFALWGIAGMILTPIIAIMVKQMAEWGWILPKRFKKKE